jgi:hypothetical protein
VRELPDDRHRDVLCASLKPTDRDEVHGGAFGKFDLSEAGGPSQFCYAVA